jgi:purine-binding chemotaxis protein CheW
MAGFFDPGEQAVMGGSQTLVVSIDNRMCAVPLAHVIETMRALPVEPLSGTPSFVQGVAMVRGVPTPVVDMGIVLGLPQAAISRFVALRVGTRQVVLAVGTVLGVRRLDDSMVQNLPPLLQGASLDAIESIGALDAQMLVVLRSGWKLPDDLWQAAATPEKSS